MLRSLFSGISGLRAHQQMMDVTGNNIANVNTVGYKTSQVEFQDTLSQMVSAAGAPQNGAGGTNPAQVGLGVRTASINANFSQGAAETTGKSSDLMIQGDGFFVVKSGGEELYTRAGSFTFDANGTLTTPNGQTVQGWPGANGVVNTSNVPGDIKLPIGVTLSPSVTTNITMTGNFSNEAAYPGDPAGSVTGATQQMSVKVYDANGAATPMVATFTKSAIDTWDMVLPDGSSTPIVFANGKGPASVTAGVAPNTYTIDTHDLTQYSGITSAHVSNSDGSASGVLSAYTVSNTGQIVGVFSNGLKETLGQVALANFNNVNGLEKIGDSMFRNTVNSGLAQVGPAGSQGLGLITAGALEMSNVDLAQEFTNLVIAQRGFQANSRVITTSDEILQELVNLKR
ncbi:MAG: flagellar hook protein FlgE [Actinoplanes sp.]|jgi:flagellar hook protein FlgE|nr:flagellar hook protein FlgE [Actinoplanes sp.]